MLGFQENVRDYLAIANAFVLPSVDEGLPIALLEALAAGVPIICTSVGAIPRLLDDEVSALFVPVHNVDVLTRAIGRLMEQPGLCRQLAQCGQAVFHDQCGAATMYGRYKQIYSRLAAGRHRPAGSRAWLSSRAGASDCGVQSCGRTAETCRCRRLAHVASRDPLD
jgi:glycosyltransferase involved in cell wall biosynthesis